MKLNKKQIMLFIFFVILGVTFGMLIFGTKMSKEYQVKRVELIQERVCIELGGKSERFNHAGYEVFFCYKNENIKP